MKGLNPQYETLNHQSPAPIVVHLITSNPKKRKASIIYSYTYGYSEYTYPNHHHISQDDDFRLSSHARKWAINYIMGLFSASHGTLALTTWSSAKLTFNITKKCHRLRTELLTHAFKWALSPSLPWPLSTTHKQKKKRKKLLDFFPRPMSSF